MESAGHPAMAIHSVTIKAVSLFKLRRFDGPVLGRIEEHPWESRAVFNPGTIREGDHVHMLYRAVEGDNFSSLGYALLDKNANIIERSGEPWLYREHPYEIRGVEDPRISRIDERYYIMYTGFDGLTCRICMASTSDFKNVTRHGIVVPDIWDKDAMLFPDPVKGKLILMHRIEPNIQIAEFNDMDHLLNADKEYWIKYFSHLDDHTIMRPLYSWEAEKIGGGAPPIRTEEGWLAIYHGVDRYSVYRAGAALFDLEDPQRIIARFPEPILEPECDYERVGDVSNVVFPQGTAEFDGQLQVYYGGADQVIGLAMAAIDEILYEILQHKI